MKTLTVDVTQDHISHAGCATHDCPIAHALSELPECPIPIVEYTIIRTSGWAGPELSTPPAAKAFIDKYDRAYQEGRHNALTHAGCLLLAKDAVKPFSFTLEIPD